MTICFFGALQCKRLRSCKQCFSYFFICLIDNKSIFVSS
nr:MAG TPA: hypothetical protein [Caudoviricetes sp.]